jgi:uncharacterized membrane protein (UPF0127 family)
MEFRDGDHVALKIGGRVIADRVIYCASSASRREGLLSLDRLERGEGILMEMPGSRRGKRGLVTSIHMLGMRFPIAAAWLDGNGRIVHSTVAKPWGPYYASPEPAWFVLEVHPDSIGDLEVGQVVTWEQGSAG